MVKLQRGEHYFSKVQTCKRKEYKLVSNVLGVNLVLKTASGIFSPRELDTGSLMLIKHMQLKKGGRVLDLGCGYGFIGLMAAKMCPSCKVIMVDINERAVWVTKKNIEKNEIPNASARQSHMFSSLKGELFDIILFNPPMSAGLDVCYEMITKSKEHLLPGGSLQMVARNRKGGSRLAEKMQEVFGNVDVLGKDSGFWVYISHNEQKDFNIRQI